jgi:RNA-directed DNA polymerase
LWDKVCAPATLEAAWKRVERNRGAAGVDAVSVERFAAGAAGYLRELHEELKRGRYAAQPVRRVMIPKPGGGHRPLGIPTVKDRIVQGALKLVIEPIFEREFLPSSYGFRPGRGAKDALREVDRLIKAGQTWVVDADLADYFGSIPHRALMERVREHISDGRVLELIERFLEQEILAGLECWRPTQGTPQGAVLSPLLANLYLHGLDRELEDGGWRAVRYADDFVVLCASAQEASEALQRVRQWVDGAGLRLHPDKTHLGDCRQRGEGFEFLGYRFERGRRRVRHKSLMALKQRIRERTGRSRGDSLARIVAELNPVLRGWYAYFKHAHGRVFAAVDGFVRRRLRALLRRHRRLTGRTGHSWADHKRWPNAFFAAQGLFSLQQAHAVASQSR